MSGTTLRAAAEPVPALAGTVARPRAGGRLIRIRTTLFGGWLSTAITLVLAYLLFRIAWSTIEWGVVRAVWSVPYTATGAPDSTACKVLDHAGACWAVIADKYRLILFGVYPYEQQWRPLICVGLFVALYVVSAMRMFWRPRLAGIWAATLLAIGVLMWGGVLGLPFVPQDQWGGLPITLILFTFGIALAFPLAVFVALGRRAKSLPGVRVLCIVYVELIRGVPLISLLYMSNEMFPLFLPNGVNVDSLLRAQVAVILFAAAYLAEVVRGGLQALPRGQVEAADALGLSYWQRTAQIELPQALRLVIPPLVNTFIGFFKDTSLVVVIGLIDLLGAGRAAFADPVWSGFSPEVYIFIAAIFFAFCFAMSRYSRALERNLSANRNR